MVWSPPAATGAAPAAWMPAKKRSIVSRLAIRSSGLVGASPTSATRQMSNGAMRLEALTLRISRDISRICAGPWRAPARFVEPRSKGTPASATSRPWALCARGVRMKVAISAKRGVTDESMGPRSSGASFMGESSLGAAASRVEAP